MPRYKPQEVVRRDAIPSRRAEVPILAVHADQEPSRYTGAHARVAARGIEMLGTLYTHRTAQKRAGKAEADFSEGYAKRQREDALGVQNALPEYVLEEAGEDYRRGYLHRCNCTAGRWKPSSGWPSLSRTKTPNP